MPLNFPSSPTNGQQYTDPNAVVWEFDGVKWNVVDGTANKTYSGVRVGFTTAYSLTATSTAVSFDDERFDTDTYFSVSTPTKVTVNRSGFFRVNFSIYTAATGSTYTVILKKNGTTNLGTATLSPNQFTNYDETLELDVGDYLEVYASESSSTGQFTTSSFLEVTRVGLALGTFVSSADAFSGARTKLTSSYATTNVSSAIAWNTVEFDQNANSAGNTYWSASATSRLTISLNGFYRVKSVIAVGASETFTANLTKNGTTTLTSTTISPNGYAQVDEIYQLNQNDYLQLYVNDLNSTGSLLSTSYLEITRIGV